MVIKKLLLGAGASLALLAGCSAPTVASAPPTTGDPAPSASAPASSAPAGSVDEFLSRVEAGMGAVKSYHAQMTMGTQAGEMAMDGDVDNSVKPPSYQMAIKVAGQQMELVVVGGKYFMKGPAGWMKMPESQTAQFQNLDQFAWLRANKEAFTKVEKVGSEQVNGAAADKYAVTMDLSKVSGDAGTSGMPKSGTVSYDAWVDADGRIVKIVSEVEVSGQKVSTNGTFSKFNEPVSIKAPEKYTEMPG